MSYAQASDGVRRKVDHIQIALQRDVEYHRITTGLEHYRLPYEALPEISRDDVDTSTMLFGKRLSMPLLISSMTGGASEAAYYNRLFAEVAQELGIAMGVGSQRVALEDPSLADTYKVRDIAPDILLFANLGAVQLNNGMGVDDCAQAVEMIGADALMLHLNPLQECVQPGGNTNFSRLSERIGEVCDVLDVPVVAKEVGHGISARTAGLLANAGVQGIDVAGAGGTSWAKVENARALDAGRRGLEPCLCEWGIPTAQSLIAVREVAPCLTLIASGGIRTGADAAKSIALGANAAGMALPLLKCAARSREALIERIAEVREELITVMFCAGCRSVDELSRAPLTRAES